MQFTLASIVLFSTERVRYRNSEVEASIVGPNKFPRVFDLCYFRIQLIKVVVNRGGGASKQRSGTKQSVVSWRLKRLFQSGTGLSVNRSSVRVRSARPPPGACRTACPTPPATYRPGRDSLPLSHLCGCSPRCSHFLSTRSPLTSSSPPVSRVRAVAVQRLFRHPPIPSGTGALARNGRCRVTISPRIKSATVESPPVRPADATTERWFASRPDRGVDSRQSLFPRFRKRADT